MRAPQSLPFRRLAALVLFALLAAAPCAAPQQPVNAPAAESAAPAAEKPKTSPTATPPPAPAAQKKDDEERRVRIERADTFRHDGDRTYNLRGNVVIRHKDLTLYCDAADYLAGETDDSEGTLRATGNLRLTDPENVITGDLLEVDFDREVALITGNVRVVTEKKQEKETVREDAAPGLSRTKDEKRLADGRNGVNPVAGRPEPNREDKQEVTRESPEPRSFKEYREKRTVITCERLEFEYADDVRRLTATPRVQAVQEDKTVWADRAVYEELAEIVTLTGNVIVRTEDGDEMHAALVVISVEEDWVQAEGVSGVTLRKRRDNGGTANDSGNAPAPAANGTAAPAAP